MPRTKGDAWLRSFPQAAGRYPRGNPAMRTEPAKIRAALSTKEAEAVSFAVPPLPRPDSQA